MYIYDFGSRFDGRHDIVVIPSNPRYFGALHLFDHTLSESSVVDHRLYSIVILCPPSIVPFQRNLHTVLQIF